MANLGPNIRHCSKAWDGEQLLLQGSCSLASSSGEGRHVFLQLKSLEGSLALGWFTVSEESGLKERGLQSLLGPGRTWLCCRVPSSGLWEPLQIPSPQEEKSRCQLSTSNKLSPHLILQPSAPSSSQSNEEDGSRVALVSHPTLGSRGHWSAAQSTGRCPERTWVKEISRLIWVLAWDRACGSQVSAVDKADLRILDLPIGTLTLS